MKFILFAILAGGTFGLMHDGFGASMITANVSAWVVAIVGLIVVSRARAWRAGFGIESHRDSAVALRHADPATYAQILASDETGVSQRDPDAYVAAWIWQAGKSGALSK